MAGACSSKGGHAATGTQPAPSPAGRIRVPGWLGRIGVRPGQANTFVPDRIKNPRWKRFVRFDCKSTVLKSLDPLPRQGNSSLRDFPFQNDEAAACPIMDARFVGYGRLCMGPNIGTMGWSGSRTVRNGNLWKSASRV